MIRTLRTAVAVAALAASLGADGAPRSGPPPTDPAPALGKKQPSAPDGALAGSLPPAAGKRDVAAPALAFDTFRYAVEVQVSGKRREEIADLEKLVALGGSAAELPEWIFRVAELHWEESQYLFFEANRKDDAIAAARSDPARVERLRVEKKELERRSREEQVLAIERYRTIALRYPRYPRLDEVLFFLGENLWRQGQRKQALGAYKLLIQKFPQSRYVPDAWMAFGEHYFDAAEKVDRAENLRNALESYRRASAYPASSVYGYSLYKQAWVQYNLGAWSEALELFRAVIDFANAATPGVAPEKKLALAREARKDYVRTYSHVGSARAASEDFARVGGQGARDMLKSLAGLYFDEGKDRDAIIVYHQLIAAAPETADAPLFQARIVTCAGRIGRKDMAVEQAQRLVAMLRDAEKRPADDAARRVLAEARRDAQDTLRALAVQYHAEYKKTHDAPVAPLAAELYRMYLDLFPDAPQAYEIRFFHAELLYALEKFAEAGDEYGRVADLDIRRLKSGPGGAPGKPGKFFGDALESAVQAFDVVAKRADAAEKRPAGDPHARLPISREQQQLLDAARRYLEYAPGGDKAVEVAYKAANVYYRHNAFPEAVALFAEIAQKHPHHELARYAANLALDSYNLVGAWSEVLTWARRFRADAELMRAQPLLRADLEKVIEQSSFKLVEQLERAGRHADAAEAYLAFARDWPASKLAPTALYDASVDLVRAGRLEHAMRVREQLVARHPSDPLVPKVVFVDAQDREAVGDFDRAAEAYERYHQGWRRAALAASSPPAPAPRRTRAHGQRTGAAAQAGRRPAGDAGGYEEAKARDALYDAGVLREALGQLARAEADRRLFGETGPGAPDAAKVFLSIADLHRRARQPAKELRQLEEYQQQWAKDATEWLVVQERIAKLHERTGNAVAARRAYDAALQYWKAHRTHVADRGMPVVAQAEYLALEPAFAAYDAIDFAVPGKLSPQRQVRWLKERAETKGKKLLELQRSYTAVVNLKQAEPAVCALYKIGLGYERFAQAFQSAPLPAEVRREPALAQEYRAQLAQLAEAPEKKANEALEYAIVKSRELGVTNACTRSAAEILAKGKRDGFGPPLERIPPLVAPARLARPAGRGLVRALVERTAPGAAPTAAPPIPRLRQGEPPVAARDRRPDPSPDDEDLLP